jgi:hypothetical protein
LYVLKNRLTAVNHERRGKPTGEVQMISKEKFEQMRRKKDENN